MVPTNEALPPPCLATDRRLKFTSLQRNVGPKWSGCMLAAARTQFQLENYLQQASNFLYAKPVDFIGPNCFHFETLQIFQCRGFTWRMFSQGAQSNLQLPAGCFGCSVSERHQMLTGMRFGTMCCIYGMNGSQTLLQMHTPTVELSSACKPAGGPFRAQAKGNDIYAKYVEHG